MQAAIEFLSGIAPIFTDYLVIFQSDEPLVHCMFDALKTMVLTILGRFLQPDLLKDIPMAVLCRIDLEKEDNYLLLESIDIDVKAKLKYVKNIQVFFILWSHNWFPYKQEIQG